MRNLLTGGPAPFRVPPGGSLRTLLLTWLSMGFLVGCGCLYVYFFGRRLPALQRGAASREGEPTAKTLRLVESLPLTRLADVQPGSLVAVSGKVIGGRRIPPAGGAEAIESPWVASPPAEVHRYLVLEDGSGATLQVGRKEVGTFRVGDQVFAVGKVEGRAGDAPYRSATSEPVLLPGDGVFIVLRGTKAEALDELRKRPTNGSRAPLILLAVGILLVVGCALGALIV